MLLVIIADGYGKATVIAYHEANPRSVLATLVVQKKTIPRFNNNLSTNVQTMGI